MDSRTLPCDFCVRYKFNELDAELVQIHKMHKYVAAKFGKNLCDVSIWNMWFLICLTYSLLFFAHDIVGLLMDWILGSRLLNLATLTNRK